MTKESNMVLNPHELETHLLASPAPQRIEGLPSSYVWPRYGGRSVANIPATIGHLLGVPQGWLSPPLEDELWKGLSEGVERVVLMLVDGVGWRRLWQVVKDKDPTFESFLAQQGASVFPITTVSPSTTSVATTTYWGNGATPAEHGMLGYTFLLAQYSAVCNMLFWKPAGRGKGGYGELIQWGIEPETFLPTPSISQVLAKQGIPTTCIMPQAITRSPLSAMQMRQADVRGYTNDTDLWLSLHSWLQVNQNKRAYCYLYYPDFDSFSHRDGPNAPSWEKLWRTFRFHWQTLLDELPTGARKKTMFIISADHGHVHSSPEKSYFLDQHPELTQHFSFMPGGEPRHAYLYARPGHKTAIRDYYVEHLAADFHLLDAKQALQAGLYGSPAAFHPDAERRIGEFVLLSKKGATIWPQPPDKKLIGMHGSLEPEEMIVPFIAFRFDH